VSEHRVFTARGREVTTLAKGKNMKKEKKKPKQKK
jgi:hypothetical protein